MLAQAGDMLFTALHSAADTGTFGLADKASAGVAAGLSQVLPNAQPMSYDDAYAKIKANSQAMAGRNPVSAAVGDVGGMVAGAGGLAKAAKMIPGVGAVLDAAAPVAGAPVTNVLKSAAVGGAGAAGYTAADEAVRQGTIDPNAVLTNGVLGAVAAPVVSKVAQAVIGKLANPTTKAMAVLASKIGETPDDLATAYSNFQTATGRVPTMAEIVSMKSTGELSQLIKNSPTITTAANTAADTAGAQRSSSLAKIVDDNGGGPQSISQLTTARKTNMDTAMKPLRGSSVGIDTQDAGLLDDPRVRSVLRDSPELASRVRDAVQEARDGGTSDALTVGDIDAIRAGIRSRQSTFYNKTNPRYNPTVGHQFGNLADNITALGTSSEPGYQDALEQFGRDSDYIAGFSHGNAGKAIGDAEHDPLINSLATPEGQQGHAAGIATRTADAIGDSPSGAIRTAAQLAQGGGDSAVLRGAVGQDSFNTIQRAATAESRGAANLKALAGNPGAEPEPTGVLHHLGQAGGALAAHSPTTVVYHAAKAIPSFAKMAPAVQNKVAQYLLNPNMTQQGINLLRKAGAKDADIRKLAVALSAQTGLNAGADLQP